MSALYGVKTYLDSGKVNITPDGVGGVFIQLVTFTHKAGTVRVTFTDLLGMSIFYFTYYGGSHDVSSGVDGSGRPYVEAVGHPDPTWTPNPPVWAPGSFDTIVGVYAR